MARKLGLVDAAEMGQFLGLFADLGSGRPSLLLPSEDSVFAWVKRCDRIVLKICLMVQKLRESKDPGMLNLRRVQATHDLANGILAADPVNLDLLAALLMQIRNGPFNPKVHRPGSMIDKLMELVPWMALESRKPSKWDSDILRRYRELSERRIDPMHEYLALVKKYEHYGCSRFDVLDERMKQAFIHVNEDAIEICDEGEDIMKEISWKAFRAWRFNNERSLILITDVEHIFQVDPLACVSLSILLARYTNYFSQATEESKNDKDDDDSNNEGEDVEYEEDEGEENEGEEDESEQEEEDMDVRAVVRLQACARGVLARKRLYAEDGAIYLQAVIRGYLVRKEFVESKSAVTELQAFVRGYLIRKEYEKSRNAVTELQAFTRGFLARSKSHRSSLTEKENAVSKIQALYRGMKARELFDEILQQEISESAAMKIQAIFRGVNAREAFEEILLEEIKNEHAVQIQALFRGHRLRKRFQELVEKHAAARVQALIRGYLDRKRKSRDNENERKRPVAPALPPPTPPKDVESLGEDGDDEIENEDEDEDEEYLPEIPPPPDVPPPGLDDDTDDEERIDEEQEQENVKKQRHLKPHPPSSPPPPSPSKFVLPKPPGGLPPGVTDDEEFEV